jgi:hypothetical protein
MTHKGRCFRDRRRTKMRKLKQKIAELLLPKSVKVVPLESPRELHNTIAEAIGEPKLETSFKRRSW